MSCAAVSPAATTRSALRSATCPATRSASLLDVFFSATPYPPQPRRFYSSPCRLSHLETRSSHSVFRADTQPSRDRGQEAIPVSCRHILLMLLAVVTVQISTAQTAPPTTLAISQPISGHLLILYRNRVIPPNADALAHVAGARSLHHLSHLGVTALSVAPADESRAIAQLAANPEVALVLHDRYVTGHSIRISRIQLAVPLDAGDPTTSGNGTSSTITRHSVARAPIKPRNDPDPPPNSGNNESSSTSGDNPPPPTTDLYYNSPLGWAVRATGGYGDSVPGGAASGPWNTSLGAGVRIAILDSGVDANHPDITPNLALNLSEV